jgi:hypothetical protein
VRYCRVLPWYSESPSEDDNQQKAREEKKYSNLRNNFFVLCKISLQLQLQFFNDWERRGKCRKRLNPLNSAEHVVSRELRWKKRFLVMLGSGGFWGLINEIEVDLGSWDDWIKKSPAATSLSKHLTVLDNPTNQLDEPAQSAAKVSFEPLAAWKNLFRVRQSWEMYQWIESVNNEQQEKSDFFKGKLIDKPLNTSKTNQVKQEEN